MTPPRDNPYGLPPANPYVHPHAQQGHSQPPQPQPGYSQPGYSQPGYSQPPQQGYSQPQPGPAFNPYVPPSAGAQGQWSPGVGFGFVPGQQLADRGTRLAAHMIDYGLYAVPLAVSAPAAVVSPEAYAGLMMLLTIGIAVYQWILMSTTGQSLGKKWLKIRIVKLDGSPVDFVSAVLMRSWAFVALVGVTSFLAVGALLPLVDALMIFGDDRRCMHDHMAGTKVIVA